MSYLSGLIPARFLIITAHLTIVLTAFWGKDENVEACLPYDYSQHDFDRKNYELTIGLGLSLFFLGLELTSFMAGVSLFWPLVCLVSIITHCLGSISMGFFLMDEWDCDLFWIIFTISIIIPTISELLTVCGVFILKK